MSLSVLCDAVVRHLRSTCSFTDDECDIQPMPGEPPVDCPLRYVSVVPRGTRFLSGRGKFAGGVLEEYDVEVVLTRRTTDCPKDRRGRLLWLKATSGIEALTRNVLLAIHDSETLVYTVANSLIPGVGVTVNGFLELLAGPSQVPGPQPVSSQWFGADGEELTAGLKVSMVFSGGKRFQHKSTAI